MFRILTKELVFSIFVFTKQEETTAVTQNIETRLMQVCQEAFEAVVNHNRAPYSEITKAAGLYISAAAKARDAGLLGKETYDTILRDTYAKATSRCL
jgi:hypothetical protein